MIFSDLFFDISGPFGIDKIEDEKQLSIHRHEFRQGADQIIKSFGSAGMAVIGYYEAIIPSVLVFP